VLNNKLDIIHLLAFGFGAGKSPVAPGTFGTLVGIPFYLMMTGLNLWQYILVTVVLFVVGIWICHYSSKKMGVHDHPGIVWDEIVGYLVTMIAAPSGWLWIVIGFVLFRFFDILKPWPIRAIDKGVSGGFGIMLDDILAGLFALLILQLIAYFIL
jgi:phosphatidylglycerophosphatase A